MLFFWLFLSLYSCIMTKGMVWIELLWLILKRFAISLLIVLVGEIRGYFYTTNFSPSTIFVFQTLSRIAKKAMFLHVFSAKRSHSRQTVVHHFTATRVGAGALWCEQQTKPNIRRSLLFSSAHSAQLSSSKWSEVKWLLFIFSQCWKKGSKMMILNACLFISEIER